MRIWEYVLLALNSLKTSKMRSLLTMLGIIIGISSVIAIVTVGNSLTGSLTNSMSSFGVNAITVSLTQKSSSNSSGGFRMFMGNSIASEDLLNDAMLAEYKEAYGQYIDTISLTESLGSTTASYSANDMSVSVTGTNSDYQKAQNIEIVTGRYVKESDDERNVCVVADAMVEELFGIMQSPIGKTLDIEVGNHSVEFYIVGVYAYSSESVSMDGSVTYPLYIPLQTAKKYNQAEQGYQSFSVSCNSEVGVTEFMQATETFFQSFYTRNEAYTVEASSMETMVETMTEMLSTVSLAIAAIAAISLLVGGIGVMNIMLVSITERTREIGTRIALGATQNNIRMQFIVESAVICLVGGLIGVIVGIGLSAIACQILGYVVQPSLQVVVIAVIFSASIGIFFGYYPANKAAKMNPIDALRYE